jgi:hypothetical protein
MRFPVGLFVITAEEVPLMRNTLAGKELLKPNSRGEDGRAVFIANIDVDSRK